MKYFKESEFKCKHCGDVHMNPSTLERLDKARELAGIPFKITSGWRCETHNKAVGGKSDSAHTRGYAIDISCIDSQSRFKIIQSLLEVGFTRIGIAKTFIHADDDPSLIQRVIWEY